MAQLDLYLYFGDELVTGGNSVGTQGQFPLVDYPAILGARSFGHGLRMEEFHRVEPSDANGASGGTYDPYWDGTTFSYTSSQNSTSTGTPTTTTIQRAASTWTTNEFAGLTVEITSGGQSGQTSVISSNTSNTLTFAPALPGAPVAGDTFRIRPSTTTLISAAATWGTNEFAGRLVTVTSGAQSGVQRRITSNTATKLTISALPGAPTSGDTFRVEGGFVKFYHAPTTSASGLPLIADQTLAGGDNWFSGGKHVSPMAMWMRRLVAQYGHTGNGFRVLKEAYTAGIGDWKFSGAAGTLLDTQIAAAIDFETNAGNTLKVKAAVVDAVTRDLFAINLFYESDAQRTIDSLRDRFNVRGIADAPTVATATSSTTATVTVSTATWTVDQWKGRTVRIDAGAMSGELRLVASNTATTITFYDNTSAGQNYGPLASAPGNVQFSILAAPLIILASPHVGIATSISTVLAPGARTANQNIAARNVGVRVLDWSFATIATADEIGGASYVGAVASDRFYDVPSVITAGTAIHNAITAFYTTLPSTAPGAAIPCIFVTSASQWVTSSQTAQAITYSLQYSLQGDSPGTVTPLCWIWNNVTETVQLMDVTTNCSTFGTVLAGNAGPEVVMARDLVRDQFSTGVVVFKYAKAGVALTSEAGSATAAGYIEPGGGAWDTIEVQFAKFKAAVMRDLGRSVDVIAIIDDNSENDMTQLTAFKSKAPVHIDRCRQLCQTRVSNYVIPVFKMQPPPHAVDVVGGSVFGDPVNRRDVRAWIEDTLPTLRERVYVLENPGPSRYELQRNENVHYAVEATFHLGHDFAEMIIEQFNADAEGETGEETSPSETAAFVVEDGSGLTDANSFCSVADADDYHERYGNPVTWTGLTDAQKEDWLRQATREAVETYAMHWQGYQVSSTQALPWPREFVIGPTGDYLADDEVPTVLRDWVARWALAMRNGESMSPVAQTGADIRSESLTSAGGFSKTTTYAGSKTAIKRYPAMDRMLLSAGLIYRMGGWGVSAG